MAVTKPGSPPITPLVVTAFFAVSAALVFFGVRQRSVPPPSLTPREEKIAGLSSARYEEVGTLTKRISAGGASPADWNALGQVLRERAPVGRSLAIASFTNLLAPAERARALALLKEDAERTPPGEPLHQLTTLVLTQYAKNGGADGVRTFLTSSDARVRELAKEVLP